MSQTINWGIIGLGKIAHKFAQDLQLITNAKLYAVASRSEEKAIFFGKQYHASKYYSSYQKLANDPTVDVVYIATPHIYHCQLTLMCLEAGKHVLCEKAFGMNAKEVESMVQKAREKNLFLMEALWTRFIPATEKVVSLLNSNAIGDTLLVKADFGFRAEYSPEKRLFNKALGGGSLLDIGLYPVFLSLLILGVPKQIHAKAIMSKTGVDSACAMIFSYRNDKMAVLDASFLVATPQEAFIHGTEGFLKLHSSFHHTQQISHYVGKELTEIYNIEYVGNGYYHEIIEVMECLKAGKTESEKMPLNFSLLLIETLDRVRKEIDLIYQ